MRKNSYQFKMLLLCLVPAVVVGCANTPTPASRGVYVPSISELKPEDYPGEIEKYTKIIQSDFHQDIQQHAHLYLASLYFSPMNPNRNYELALMHLETYALYDPDFANGIDPRLLMSAVMEIKRISARAEAQSKQIRALNREVELMQRQAEASWGSRQDIRQTNLRLKNRIGKLQRKIRSLEISNAQLNKTIEMLSTLDSRLEEKRSNFIKKESIE